MSVAVFAAFAAAGLAMLSATFGVAMARLVWAEDLKHAQRIDEIRSRTEISLKNTIESLERQIAILKQSRS